MLRKSADSSKNLTPFGAEAIIHKTDALCKGDETMEQPNCHE